MSGVNVQRGECESYGGPEEMKMVIVDTTRWVVELGGRLR